MESTDPTSHCSFCGKTKSQVPKLIQGPGNVQICNECVDICNRIVQDSQTDALVTDRLVALAFPTPQSLLACIKKAPRGQRSIGECVFSIAADIRAAMIDGKRELKLSLDTFESSERGSAIVDLMRDLDWNIEIKVHAPDGDYVHIQW